MASAYFVYRPGTIAELKRLHLLSDEREFEIVHTVVIPAIDFENFITDMRVSRQFIFDSMDGCAAGKTMKCIFVKKRRSFSGILTVPDENGGVLWAACLDV